MQAHSAGFGKVIIIWHLWFLTAVGQHVRSAVFVSLSLFHSYHGAENKNLQTLYPMRCLAALRFHVVGLICSSFYDLQYMIDSLVRYPGSRSQIPDPSGSRNPHSSLPFWLIVCTCDAGVCSLAASAYFLVRCAVCCLWVRQTVRLDDSSLFMPALYLQTNLPIVDWLST